MKILMLQLAVLMMISTCLFSQERYSKISIPVSSRQDVINIAKLGISLEGAARRVKDQIDIFVNDQEVQLLKEKGIGFSTLIPDWNAYYAERQKHETQPVSALLRKSTLTNFHLGSMGGFLTYEELRADLDSMRAKYPALISVRDSIGASYENRPIWAVGISKNPTPGSQPQALYMGVHHANEPAGMMSLIYFMWYMLENYGSDPEVTMLLENRELWFIPLVNPDGYCYNEQTNPAGGGMWYKSRHPNPGGSVGVNLNGNYDFKWGYDDIGSSPEPSSGGYRGTAPFSEPETQVIRDFVLARHFTMAHSFHTYFDFIASPWAYLNQETPDSMLFRTLEQDMTALNRYSFGGDFFGAGTGNGETCDWLYGDTISKPKIYAFTVEVGAMADGKWPPLSRILPLAMENVRTNLVLAHAAGNYIRIDKSRVTCQFNTDSVTVSIPFINSGAGSTATTLDINVSCPDLDIATPHYSGYAWNAPGLLIIHARKNKPIGTKVSMSFELNYQGGRTLDTVTFRLGPADVIYADNAEGTRSRWSSVSNKALLWDETFKQAHSGLFSFSESPYSDYASNLTSTFTLDSALVLNGTVAELRLWLKGRIEDDYDCLRVEITTNHGGTWNALEGRYTSPGSGASMQQPFQSPVLDGYKYDWLEEVMDLGGYVGDTIQIRFRFTSDNANQYDGFYIDDISVQTYGKLWDGVEAKQQLQPIAFALLQNYPNPFNPSTTIEYQIPKQSIVTLKIFDLLGREVATLVNEMKYAGPYKISWDGSRLSSGVYFYTLSAGQFRETKRMILMK